MKPKKEIRLLILLVQIIFFSLFHTYGQTGLPVSKHYSLERLADGVYAAIHNNDGGYAICNAGIIDLGDKTIVIDPFISPIPARDLKQHAEYLTGRPVSLVLNLDPHNDHTSGNQVFVPGADIIGTPNARKYIQDNFDEEVEYYKETSPKELLKIQKQLKEASDDEKAELVLWQAYNQAIIESFSELKMTLPNMTVNDTLIIYGSKRRIVVIPTGSGHTNGDMVAYLPEENIIFMSDQLFVKCHPYMGDGDPESWKNNLKQIIGLNPEIAIPGHGPVGDVNSIYMMIDYIDTLTEMVNGEIQKGTDENKVMELPMPEKYNNWSVSSFYKINLKFLYHKLIPKTNTVL
jgi:glyoxylase-like metal-dependent hydrolase (beta-lactamase superfamily II)